MKAKIVLILEKQGIWLLVAMFCTFAVGNVLISPLLESPDELLNYENMRAIIDQKRLPVLQPGELSKAHHPPLYYLIGALLTSPIPDGNLEAMGENINRFFGFRTYDFGVDNKSQYLHGTPAEAWPWHDAALGLYLLRFVSILFGVGGILAVHKIGRTLFDEPAVPLLAAGLVALNPMYVYIQSSVHNDALTNFLAACAILSVVLYWQTSSTKQAMIVGLVCALGILTKITFLFLGPMVLVVMFGRHFVLRDGDSKWFRLFAKNIVVAGVIVVGVAGWWFVRNQMLYGEPTSMELQASIWQPRPNAPDWPAAIGELSYLRDSFWGAFGFGQIVFPRAVYRTMNAVVVLASAGLLVWLAGFSQVGLKARSHRWLLALLLIAPLTAFSATFSRMAISATANFGRYLFTSYGVLAPLLALGLFSLVRLLTRGRKSADLPFVSLLILGLIGLNTYTLFGVIRPVYAPPPVYASAADLPPQVPFSVEFADGPTLLGYALDTNTAVPGEPFWVTLFWQGTSDGHEENLSEFVQLVSADGARIAGRDTLHGLGRYPTGRWRAGEIVEDRIPLYLPQDANFGPAGLRLDIGLKDVDGRAIPMRNGETTLTLATIRLAPPPSAPDSQQVTEMALYTFGDAILLTDLNQLPETVMPGDQIDLTMRWRSIAPVADELVVLIHWVQPGDPQPVVQFDGPPNGNSFPTTLWQPGDTITDQRTLDIPADLPAGEYQVLIGLYRRGDFARLSAVDGAGNRLPADAVPIGPITVAP